MIATTTAGKVKGIDKGAVLQFRGMRYATATRFGPPQPVEPWDGVADATRFGLIAPQNPSPTEAMLGAQDVPSGEDCLFLNVFTPALDDRARPVLVWIHGGAYAAGSSSVPWYDGTNLATRGDAVVVTVNYRLGALGFLHVDGFPGAGASGLADQIAALEWVRDNIAAFGGDPAKVTIFGESAGGMSVGSLLAAPRAAGLFRAAVPQSGTGEFVHTIESAAEITAGVLHELGSDDVGVLLDATVEQLLAAQQAVATRTRVRADRYLPFMPVVDGSVLDRRPLDAIRAGSAANVRVLAGTTTDEWNLFHVMERMQGDFDEGKLRRRVDAVLGDRADDLVDVYRAQRPGASPDDLWCAIATDWVFRMPAIRLLEAQAAHQRDTWAYEMAFRSSAFGGHLGACHGIDVPFVFDTLHRAGVDFLLGGLDDDARRLGRQMSGAWLALATALSPEHDDLPPWPRYTADDRSVLCFDRGPELVVDPRAAERAAWADIPY